MRTTLTINDELLNRAKKLAAKRKSNVSAIVNEALRKALKEDRVATNGRPFKVPVYHAKGRAKNMSPGEMKDLLAAEESEPYAD